MAPIVTSLLKHEWYEATVTGANFPKLNVKYKDGTVTDQDVICNAETPAWYVTPWSGSQLGVRQNIPTYQWGANKGAEA